MGVEKSKGIRKWARTVSLMVFILGVVGLLPFLIFLEIAQPGFFIEDSTIKLMILTTWSVLGVSAGILLCTTNSLYKDYADYLRERIKKEA